MDVQKAAEVTFEDAEREIGKVREECWEEHPYFGRAMVLLMKLRMGLYKDEPQAMRWLGWSQGVLCAARVVSVGRCKGINREA